MMAHALLLAARLLVTDPLPPGEYELVPVTTTSTAQPTTTSSSSSSSSSSTTSSTSSTTSSTAVAGGLAFYVSVDGNDAAGDGRRVNPFRTGNKALSIAKAGDSVLLMDNADTKPHAPIKVINRTNLTVGCENEGKCAIITPGGSGVEISGSTAITLRGTGVKMLERANVSGPTSTVLVQNSSRIHIHRNIVWYNNRHYNAHPIQLVNVTQSVVTENAVLEHSRHGVSLHRSHDNYVARNWIDNRGRIELDPNVKPPGGRSRESIAVYPGSRNVVANNLIEGATAWGINLNASGPEDDSQVVGNIVAGTYLGYKVYARPTGVPVRSIFRDNIASRVGPSFDIRDQVSIDSLFERFTAFAGTGGGMQVDNPASGDAQLSCADVQGTPGVTIRDSILPKLEVKPCTGKTRKCAVSNSIIPSRTIMAGCTVSGLTGTLPATVGDSGTRGLVRGVGTIGADVRCVIDRNGDRTPNSLWGVDGQFRFCPPERAGWPTGCRDYAARRLNHRPDGSGLPLREVACP